MLEIYWLRLSKCDAVPAFKSLVVCLALKPITDVPHQTFAAWQAPQQQLSRIPLATLSLFPVCLVSPCHVCWIIAAVVGQINTLQLSLLPLSEESSQHFPRLSYNNSIVAAVVVGRIDVTTPRFCRRIWVLLVPRTPGCCSMADTVVLSQLHVPSTIFVVVRGCPSTTTTKQHLCMHASCRTWSRYC
jgi:hypothetical protein